MGKGGEGEEGKEYIEKPQIQKALAKCLLLFSCSVISDSSVTPWTVAHQAPVSVRFPRWEYWNGLPFPSPGDLPDSGIERGSPALAGGFLPLSHPPGKPTTPDTKGKRQGQRQVQGLMLITEPFKVYSKCKIYHLHIKPFLLLILPTIKLSFTRT